MSTPGRGHGSRHQCAPERFRLDTFRVIYSNNPSNRQRRVIGPCQVWSVTMSDLDVRRLREDLDAIELAAGLTLPFRWADVWQTLAMAPAGALLAAWAYFGPPEYLAVGLVPLVLLAAV